MPAIVRALGGTELYAWAFSAYLITQAVTIPIYGRLADIAGRKRIFLVGSIIFAIGTALCSCSRGMMELVLFRAIQGCGAGAIQPIAYTIVADVYTPVKRARIQGLLSGVFGLAASGGPLLAPFLIQALGWQSIFWANLPIIALATAMILLFLKEEPRRTRRSIDVLGACLLTVVLTTILVVADQWHQFGLLELSLMLATVAVASVWLWRHQSRIAEPIIPRQLLSNSVVRLGSTGALSNGISIMTLIPFLPIFVSSGLGWTFTTAGVVIGVLVVVWTLGSVCAGQLLPYVSYQKVGLFGAGLLVIGSSILLAMPHNAGIYGLAAAILALGVGLGFCNTTFVVAVQTSVPYEQRGSATSTVLFTRFLGQALGAAFGGIVISTGLHLLFPNVTDPFGVLLQAHGASPLTSADGSARLLWITKASFTLTLGAGFTSLLVCLHLPSGLTTRSQTNHAVSEGTFASEVKVMER